MYSPSYIWASLLKSGDYTGAEGKHNLGPAFVLFLLCLQSLSIFALLFCHNLHIFNPSALFADVAGIFCLGLSLTDCDSQGHWLKFSRVSACWG
jgi:hypothetical protein